MKKLILAIVLIAAVAMCRAQDFALARLESSPRHHEWVEVKAGDRQVHCFVAYPEKSANTMAVLVIHENRGLTDWVRSLADQVAEAGYLAIAPDLLSGFSAEYDRTADFPSSDEARTGIYELPPDQVTNDLRAVRDYIAGVPAANGKVVVMGFCWGGSQTFRFATNSDEIQVAMVFYGTAPAEGQGMENITVPVYGFYGGEDQRVNATIPDTEARMAGVGKTYEYEKYKGAGHAFMRRGDDPQGEKPNKKARKRAWKRVKKILGRL